MKAPSLTIQKLWPLLKFFCRQNKKQSKTICPPSSNHLAIRGHEKKIRHVSDRKNNSNAPNSHFLFKCDLHILMNKVRNKERNE